MFQYFFLFFQIVDFGMEEVIQESESLFFIIVSSGIMGIIIVVIFLFLVVIVIVIFFECYVIIKQVGCIDENFINNIRVNVFFGNIVGVKVFC